MKYTNIIFLDIDGVLNCQLFYEESMWHKLLLDKIPLYRQVKKLLRKLLKRKDINWDEYYASQLCKNRIAMLNNLCEETDSVVVVSSSWRNGKTVDELQKILNNSGATFKIIDKTPFTGYERGTEISKWLKDNINKEEHGCLYFDFYRYAIIDDDSDMLLNQANHFFQTDNYSGLTHNTCYRIKRFFNHETF
jgi:hypothetical protein